MRMTAVVALATVVATGLGAAGASGQEQRFVSVGTGGVTGVYYPAGGAICRLVNRDRKEHGIRCSVESTGGSVFNIDTIRQGELDFGMAQSDVQENALLGIREFEDTGAFPELRAAFSLYPEPLTLVARADSGIASLEDLEGKRVNIGNRGSGQRAAMDLLMDRLGWTTNDLALASKLKSSEQAQALCDNKIDAYAFTVGHPNGSLQETMMSCDAVLISATGRVVDQLVADVPSYAHATIPGGLYRGSDSDVQTYGPRATFVTSANVPEEVVYELVKAVFENIDTFRNLHPAFANLDPKQMATEGLSAPLHPGAERYYKEAGLQ